MNGKGVPLPRCSWPPELSAGLQRQCTRLNFHFPHSSRPFFVVMIYLFLYKYIYIYLSSLNILLLSREHKDTLPCVWFPVRVRSSARVKADKWTLTGFLLSRGCYNIKSRELIFARGSNNTQLSRAVLNTIKVHNCNTNYVLLKEQCWNDICKSTCRLKNKTTTTMEYTKREYCSCLKR